jgi:hypothetical protein
MMYNAFSGPKTIRLRTTYENCPTVIPSDPTGTRNLYLSILGTSFPTFITIGTLSGYLDNSLEDSNDLFSSEYRFLNIVFTLIYYFLYSVKRSLDLKLKRSLDLKLKRSLACNNNEKYPYRRNLLSYSRYI